MGKGKTSVYPKRLPRTYFQATDSDFEDEVAGPKKVAGRALPTKIRKQPSATLPQSVKSDHDTSVSFHRFFPYSMENQFQSTVWVGHCNAYRLFRGIAIHTVTQTHGMLDTCTDRFVQSKVALARYLLTFAYLNRLNCMVTHFSFLIAAKPKAKSKTHRNDRD